MLHILKAANRSGNGEIIMKFFYFQFMKWGTDAKNCREVMIQSEQFVLKMWQKYLFHELKHTNTSIILYIILCIIIVLINNYILHLYFA